MSNPKILDNTPYWLEDRRTGSGEGLGRCNPYGYERDPQVMGGVHDLKHEKFMYFCQNQADARYWLTCQYGHRGQVTVCYAHAMMIRRRMVELCPRCAWPDEARQIDKSMNDTMAELACHPAPFDPERARLLVRLDDLRGRMDELIRTGVIKKGGPLQLSEVS